MTRELEENVGPRLSRMSARVWVRVKVVGAGDHRSRTMEGGDVMVRRDAIQRWRGTRDDGRGHETNLVAPKRWR